MRADVYLTENGYVSSRQRAKTLIEGKNVLVDGVLLTEENAYELLEIKMYDNVLRICNTEG